ncbi:hypothetical protein J6590_076367, partial [Homalodisca vitripennis]
KSPQGEADLFYILFVIMNLCEDLIELYKYSQTYYSQPENALHSACRPSEYCVWMGMTTPRSIHLLSTTCASCQRVLTCRTCPAHISRPRCKL